MIAILFVVVAMLPVLAAATKLFSVEFGILLELAILIVCYVTTDIEVKVTVRK